MRSTPRSGAATLGGDRRQTGQMEATTVFKASIKQVYSRTELTGNKYSTVEDIYGWKPVRQQERTEEEKIGA